jgi:hypothetical protein
MTSKQKVLQVYPNAWSQRGIGTLTRGYVWAGDGSTRKLVDMDKTRLRESELWLGAWRRVQEILRERAKENRRIAKAFSC